MSTKSDSLASSPDRGCINDSWRTPPHVLERVRRLLGDGWLDPCSDPSRWTAGFGACHHFDDENACGLTSPWPQVPTYLNPPYGRALRAWIERIGRETCSAWKRPMLALLPANQLETGYLQDSLLGIDLTCHVWFRRRLAFIGANGQPVRNNTFGSILWVWGVDPLLVYEQFSDLGAVIKTEALP